MKTRILKFDNLKVVLIFLVVLGHVIDPIAQYSLNLRRISLFIYSFHMPLFIMISGMFSRKHIEEKRYDKIVAFLIMAILINILILISRVMVGKSMFSFSLLSISNASWYAFAIFVYCLIMIYLRRYTVQYLLLTAVVLGCVVGYDVNLGDFLALARIIVFFPFFLIGYYLNREKVCQLSRGRIYFFAVSVIILFSIGIILGTEQLYFMRPLLLGRMPYVELGTAFARWGGVMRLAYYVVITLLCFCIICVVPEKNFAVTKIGGRTRQIYILHYPLICLLYGWVKVPALFRKLYPQAPFALTIPVAIIIMLFCGIKIWERPIEKILYPDKQKMEDKTI